MERLFCIKYLIIVILFCSSVLEEINVDIFDLSSDVSLAHSIGEDLIMNAGIAVHFR